MMKKIIIAMASAALVSCGGSGFETARRSSTGKPYELFVVVDEDKWAEGNAVGDTLRSILWEPFPMVNTYEPYYATFQAPENRFVNLLRKYRNILMYRVGTQYDKPSLTAEYDKWAEPQIVVSLTAPDDSTALAYLDVAENREALLKIFDIAEMDRFIYQAKRLDDHNITDVVRERFGLEISIPMGYKIAADQPDFMWIRYEPPLVSQGIIIYKYPFTNRYAFAAPYLLEKRNEFVARVPGPEEGSYMTTSDVIMPEAVPVEIDGRVWFRLQGFWDVEGDFMGGPFTAYSTVDATTREVITIDTYVFSPRYDKRHYVRQLQAMVQTASIPGDTIRRVNTSDLPEQEPNLE